MAFDMYNSIANASSSLFGTWLASEQSNPDLFLKCWRLQTCDSCLRCPHPCSWCAISQTCVPNDRSTIPILAPIRNENICPLGWQERWEMRAKPFSCRCSTMTFMSVVVSVLSTLLTVLAIWLLQKLFRWSWRRWKKRQSGWWKIGWKQCGRKTLFCKRRKGEQHQTTDTEEASSEEQRPLLV